MTIGSAMNLRRVRSPEERPGTNTSIGRVVVRDRQNQLSEKTDRSGFIENNAFRDLQIFCVRFHGLDGKMQTKGS